MGGGVRGGGYGGGVEKCVGMRGYEGKELIFGSGDRKNSSLCYAAGLSPPTPTSIAPLALRFPTQQPKRRSPIPLG